MFLTHPKAIDANIAKNIRKSKGERQIIVALSIDQKIGSGGNDCQAKRI